LEAKTWGVSKTEYSNHQLENWTKSFASFNFDGDSEIPVGVQLAIEDSESDIFVKSRDLLLARPEVVVTILFPDNIPIYGDSKSESCL
jgi:hypothetical protein